MEMFKLLSVCLFLLVIIPFSNNAVLSTYEQKRFKQFLEGQGLYSNDDDVEILTIHNFKTEVMGAPYAWLVEFYNSWCGFCQRFAPSWRALATDIKGWRDLIRVGVMDCSDEDNFPVCREYEIMSYPTLRYFHENYQPGPDKFGISVQKGSDFNEHRQSLIDRMGVEQIEGRGSMYPNLLPYSHIDLSKLFEGVPSNVHYAFIVVENSYLGREVALDLHKTSSIVIRHASSNNTALVNVLKVNKFPAVVAVDRNNNIEVLSQEFETRDQLRLIITNYLVNKRIKVTDETPVNKEIYTGKWLDVEAPDMATLMQERAQQALKERIKKMGDVVFQMDLETALRYSLKHEVSTVKTITGEKLEAVRAYIEVLRKYFPFGHAGQTFLTELSLYVKSTDRVEGEKIAEIVKKAEEPDSLVFSSPQQWLGCKGSQSKYRGYPCGLWKLFHYLIVNAAEQNMYNKSANPREVLEAMHGYIKNYFGCADCSQHFQEMALKRDMRNVSSFDSSILWLWMAHNEVNKRLAGDQTEDPEFPKYQFPSKENCAQCRFSNNTWNLVEVLSYVKHMYSSIHVRYIGSDTRILHFGLEGESATSGSSGIFKAIDMTRV